MAGMNPETFDGVYKDELVRRLFREERDQRVELYDAFQDEMQSYRRRMDGVSGDYFHVEEEAEGTAVYTTVSTRTVSGGPFHHLFELEKIVDESTETQNVRSFSIAVSGHALRHVRQSRKVRTIEPAAGLSVESLSVMPTSNTRIPNTASRHFRHDSLRHNTNRIRNFSYAPEKNWHPIPGEQIAVRGILSQAISAVQRLNSETIQPGAIQDLVS